ncbi:MAG: nucleotidyltransferase domain-containing protein [Candidatus Methanomethylicia archaeon]
MLNQLQELPRFTSLKKFVNSILKKEGGRILSIVLFGSMAKGTYTKHSDYDLLIVVSHEELSFKDRLYKYSKFSNGWVEAFIYSKEEVELMFKDFNPLILDSLKDGLVIYDRGFWSDLRRIFNELIANKQLTQKKNGWIIRKHIS